MCIRASYAAVRFNAHGSADGIRRPLDTQCPFLFPENPLGIWEDLNTLNISIIAYGHSPILLGLPDAEILSFDENGVHPCDYEDTDSYQITRVFINHRESLLRHLLGNET